jgi:hypothetical protein
MLELLELSGVESPVRKRLSALPSAREFVGWGVNCGRYCRKFNMRADPAVAKRATVAVVTFDPEGFGKTTANDV